VVKILSRAGVSLADCYNVQGSIAGIERLESDEVTLVHEMGGVIQSERMGLSIRRATTTALAQSTGWNVVLADLPEGVFRIFGVQMYANVIARTAHAALLLRSGDQEREIPLLVFDSAHDTESEIRMEDDGAGVATHFILNSVSPVLSPVIAVGPGQPRVMNQIAFRGNTAAFGAGSVNIRAIIQIGFTHLSGSTPSSIGLPIPSW